MDGFTKAVYWSCKKTDFGSMYSKVGEKKVKGHIYKAFIEWETDNVISKHSMSCMASKQMSQ